MTGLMFRDRQQAGRDLAAVVARHAPQDPVILAVPPGGVPVGSAIADALGAPLDVLVVGKLSAPGSPHRPLGALAADGSRAFNNEPVPDLAGVADKELSDAITVIRAELRQRERVYRRDRPFPDVTGRDVILVSDGMKTGVTMLAAARAVRLMRPRRLFAAVPAASRYAARRLQETVNDLICLENAENFLAIGCYYFDFKPTSDEEVCRLLERGTVRPEPAAAAVEPSALH